MIREIQTVGKVRHRNLVKLLEFWVRKKCGFILYEYMPNGSLDDVLHEMKPPPLLGWDVRYRIAIGMAHGLSYLHHDCRPAIIHRDIKPRNILLDSDMEPRISDFGIARLLDMRSLSSNTSVHGTFGYMAPERRLGGRASEKMDVYSYGVVVLELITRKKASMDLSFAEGMDIVSWVKCHAAEDYVNSVVDEGLQDELIESQAKSEIMGTIRIALQCTVAKAEERPSMRQVVQMLRALRPVKPVSRTSNAKGKVNVGGPSTAAGRSVMTV